jgi:hypothetical protein
LDGSKTIYFLTKTQGGTRSDRTDRAIIKDTVNPVIESLTLHQTDNSSATDNLTGGVVGFTLTFSDNNTTTSDLTDNGTGVVYYIVSDDNTTPTWSDSRWTSVDNQSSHNDNFTLSSAAAGTTTLYAWVKDNATNISGLKTDNITLLSDSTVPRLTSTVKVNSASPSAISDAAYSNSLTVTVEINAEDNESGINGYYITDDNSTAPTTASAVTWSTSGLSTVGATTVSDNVTFTYSAGEGTRSVYVYVKNTMDNISVYSASATDSIVIDMVAPFEDNTTAGTTRLSGAVNLQGDNKSYTDNLTVTLDNFTTYDWFRDNATSGGADNVSGIYSYYITDNSSRSKDNVTNSSGWQTLDNLTFTIGGAWGGYTIYGDGADNDSQGMKTFYVWVKDNATNVSGNYTTVSIHYDNLTPYISSFTLMDPTATNIAGYTNTNTGSVSFLLNNTDNTSDGGTGSNVTQYFITDNSSYSNRTESGTPLALSDNTSGDGTWINTSSSQISGTFSFDNGTNETKTVYAYVRDAAGQVSLVSSATIVLDNQTPVWGSTAIADNGSAGQYGSDNLVDNVTIRFRVSDNSSPAFDNASGFKDFMITVAAAFKNGFANADVTATNLTPTGNESYGTGLDSWITIDNLTNAGSWVGDNTSRWLYDTPYTIDVSSFGLDNNSQINFKVFFRDNASNISAAATSGLLTLDNNSD